MPITIKDWHAHQARQEQAVRRQHAPQVQAEAHRAQTVLDHPGYQMFLGRLDDQRKTWESRTKALAHELCHGRGLTAERVYQLRADLAHADGWLNGLDVARDLIPEIVKAGQEIATG